MVIDQPVCSEFEEQNVQQRNFVIIPDEEQQPQVEIEPEVQQEFHHEWAMVVYQPPVTHEPISKGVVFGPPLPPELIFKRSFETLMERAVIAKVPKALPQPHVISKRNWDLAF